MKNAFYSQQCLKFILTVFSFLTLGSFICESAISQSLPSGFSQVQVSGGISNPTVMTFAPDGRIFIAQQTGELRIIKNGSLLAQPFISLNVNSSGERGLLGIAFDPNFASNNYIYLYYTVSSAANNRISRFTANGDVVVAGSEVVILNLDPLSGATNHNGGTMQFGPDGKLYVGVGENANPPNAQNLDTYLGKILRINSDGSVPSGNPFTTGSNQKLRVWAYGVRNPYTLTFQPGTGRLFVNDVGQNTYEEVNDATTGGKNFGWPNAEGSSTNPAYANPVYFYGHGSGPGIGCAITGGTFFNPTNTNYPSTYIGKYFYLDYCSNWIDMLTLSGSTGTQTNFASNISGGPVSLVTGTDGNLYFLSRDNSSVYKIIYSGSTAPVITSQPQSQSVAQGNNVTFSVGVTGSAPLTYQWRKNGTNISGANSNTYSISSVAPANAGTYSVVITNSAGSVTSNNATLTVTVPNQAPTATISTPLASATYAAGTSISFSGSATDPESGTLGASAFTWYVTFHHDTHTHPGPTAGSGVTSGTFNIPNSGETATNVFYRLYLVVTDPQGATDTAYTDIFPRTSVITINTNPQGLAVTLDGQPFTAPYTLTSVEGMVRSIGTSSPQTYNALNYTFTNWSQGGVQTQSITTPVDDVSYTANFTTPLRDPENPANTVSGLDYKYYEGSWSVLPDFPLLTPVASGNVLNFDISPRNLNDRFGFRFSGYISVPTAGVYTFYTSSDDGSKLYIGATLVVNNDGLHGAAENQGIIGLKAGKHAITLDFFEYEGDEIITVNYQGPNFAKQPVPNSSLFRIPLATAPVITGQPQNLTVASGSAATFSVTATGTPVLSYQWRKNGVNIAGATGSTYTIASVTTSSAGTYSVVVTNAGGSTISNNATLTVTTGVNQPPNATITSPSAGATYAGGDVINFSGTGTDPESGTLGASAFTWYVLFYHATHSHAGPVIASGISNGSFVIPNSGETAIDVYYRLFLVVTDPQGVKDTAFTDLLPRTSTITFNTIPQGLTLTLDGQSFVAPLTVTSVEGMLRTISAPSPQLNNRINYNFYYWSQGGAATQTFATPVNNVGYAGVFVAGSLRDPENPANTTNGLNYSYYQGAWNYLPNFASLTPVKTGTVSNFDLSPRLQNDNFGFRYTGFISVPTDGMYYFYVSSDEGSKLYIGSNLVVNNDGLHTATERVGNMGLKAGKHAITVDFFEKTGSESLVLSYSGPGIAKQIIPASKLFRVTTSQPVTTVLNPVADAHVRAGALANTNYGSNLNLNSKNATTTDGTYQTYLRFNISAVSTSPTSIKLKLYGGLSNLNTSPLTAQVFNVTTNTWQESTITFNNKPAGEATVLGSISIGTTANQYYEFDLTQLITSLRVAGATAVSLLVKNSNVSNTTTAIFNSKENAANKPELIIIANTGRGVEEKMQPPVSVTENPVVSAFMAYPNPASNYLTVQYPEEFRNHKLKLADVSGRVLKEFMLADSNIQTISISDVPDGIYFLSIDSKNKKSVQKIMIRR